MVSEEIIQLGNLPSELIDAAMCEIRPYIVGFCTRKETPSGSVPQLQGSGTLIQVAGRYAILTAEHVVRELPKTGRLGLLLQPSRHDFTIDTNGLRYVSIARGDIDSEGPDLGAVILSSETASSIGAIKQFWNLTSHRDAMLQNPPILNSGFWIANGFPDTEKAIEADTEDGSRVMRYMNFNGVGGPREPWVVGDHDYYSFPVVPHDLYGIPRDFGGMSGGGLWQVEIRRPSGGEFSVVRKHLSGVVFYQVRTAEDVALICHGRKSVYDFALDAIARG